jgi:hypothetical protein
LQVWPFLAKERPKNDITFSFVISYSCILYYCLCFKRVMEGVME